ncbi:phage terminase small subunit [Paracandidimonas soli]|uniref:Small terminase subunit n=1 Tax=Paracandidimonas soli TaxID=1917182 RepID=A0A4R3VAB2_9BURK|nr:phage terminase small subunit [Paracandidimonas soli]TCV00504.1 small terminase subunit [Paracandidimonas soli]
MTTPAQRRFARAEAARASAHAQPGQAPAGSNAYELMLAKLYDDKRRLKEVQSIERKIEVKRELLSDYDSWVAGALEGGQGAQDEILVTVMVWRMDVGDFDEALRIAHYVLKHDLVLPDQYERTVPTVIVDEIADAALALQKNGQSFPLNLLRETHDMTVNLDMPDQASAKLHKALGYELRAAGKLPEAVEQYERALQLNDKIGVKRLITELKAEIAQGSA